MSERFVQIAIDGPAGAGKSTVARKLSERLGILYLDTGAMYRAFALFCLREGAGTAPGDDEIDRLFSRFGLEFTDGKILLNGEDISSEIRTPEIDRAVSPVSAIAHVRERMVELQKRIASDRGIVMEGRDICAVVLPDARYKFYLDASVEERARRRFEQNAAAGRPGTLEEIKEDIIRRDRADSTREAAPLKVSEDAEVIDTTGLSLEEVVEKIVSAVEEGEKE